MSLTTKLTGKISSDVVRRGEYRIRTDEVLVLSSTREWADGRLVARQQSRGFSDGVVVCTPHELDGVARGRVHCKWNVAQNPLSRSHKDRMRCSTVIRVCLGRRLIGSSGGR